MKKLLYLVPFLISAIIFVSFYERKTPKKIVVSKEEAVIEVQNKLFDKWHESTKDLLEPNFFEGFKIKTDKQNSKFSDMDDTKKSLFKILYCSKIKKESNGFSLETLNSSQKQKLDSIRKYCDQELELNKKKIYNLYGDKMHQFDKNFMDKLDVYIFN